MRISDGTTARQIESAWSWLSSYLGHREADLRSLASQRSAASKLRGMIGGDPARCINLSCGVGPPRLGRRAENKARAGVEGKGGPSVVSIDGVGLLEKEGRRRMVERGRREIFIPRESGGRAVHAPCLMRRSRFPDTDLPSGRLPYNI
jgi:hypothetical protein